MDHRADGNQSGTVELTQPIDEPERQRKPIGEPVGEPERQHKPVGEYFTFGEHQSIGVRNAGMDPRS